MKGGTVMKLKHIILPLLAVALLIGAVIQPAMAYFTTYTRAKGGYTIRQSTTTFIDESFDDWQKTVTIQNKEGKAVFIRARAFAGSEYTLTYTGENWSDGSDGWYYYSEALPAGTTASALVVSISNLPKAEEGGNFNVAVVYESTPVQYEDDGTTFADWDMILDRGGEQG